MQRRLVLWWFCFFLIGIWVQRMLPGIDILAGGVIVLLVQKQYQPLFWLLPVLIVLQEGAGSRFFGSAVLWYGVLVGFFLLGRWLFSAKNLLFVFLFSAELGAAHFGITWLMSDLQGQYIDIARLLDESVLQALVMPLVWWCSLYSYRACGES